MNSFLLSLRLALLSTCLAYPQQKSQRMVEDGGNGDLGHFVYPAWSIINFDGGCSPGGCILSFNLSSNATASAPAAAASCEINGDDLYWQSCTSLTGTNLTADDSRVWAMPLPSTESFSLSIQHRFLNASLTPTRYFNITGNMTVDFETVNLPVNLTVMGTSVSEIWYW